MAEVYKEVPAEDTTATAPEAPVEQPVTTTQPVAEQPVAAAPVVDTTRKEHRITVAERVIYLIGGILLVLLGLRFLLMLLAANSSSGFARFVYDVTHPFVAPFFGLFNYREQFGASRFEFETLIAMIVYALIMVVLARLVSLTSRRDRTA